MSSLGFVAIDEIDSDDKDFINPDRLLAGKQKGRATFSRPDRGFESKTNGPTHSSNYKEMYIREEERYFYSEGQNLALIGTRGYETRETS